MAATRQRPRYRNCHQRRRTRDAEALFHGVRTACGTIGISQENISTDQSMRGTPERYQYIMQGRRRARFNHVPE